MKEQVRSIISGAVAGAEAFDVTVPQQPEFGHFSSNVAMRLAKQLGKNPVALAAELRDKITDLAPKGFFDKIEVAPPGFLNFWLSPATVTAQVAIILKEKKKYGRAAKKTAAKVQVEFVSANPTGPLTIANGRGGFYGDALSNVLGAAGNSVEREYYVNDSGNQVLTLGKSLLAAAGLIPVEETFYKGSYIQDWAAEHASVVKRYAGRPAELGARAAKEFLGYIKRALVQKARINFDRFTSEAADIHKKGYPQKALAIFREKGFVYESEGATWLKTTEFGDDKDRVLVTSDGFPTYFLADAGHYLETKERGFTAKINVLGPDHHGYVARIQAAAKILEVRGAQVLLTQAVRLIREGAEVKMSKRRGQFITFEEVVEEIGPDAARFFFLMVSLDSHMDLDLDLAKERSVKNPVYYVQYAYVRSRSILKKAAPGISRRRPDLALLSTPEDARLVLELAKFPDVISDTAADYQVHRLTRYAQDLARALHAFYEKERIMGEERELASARAALVRAAVVVFENLFELLGITAPEKM